MLSFDITDKTIKIVKGTESGGKITISDAVTIDIEDNSIENGKISDTAGLANKISMVLREKRFKEKNAIASISSNQTIFKELTIPKVNGNKFLKMVKAEMQSQLGIDDTYSISYVIIDEYKADKKSAPVVKILATACPYDVIDNCKRLFSLLSLKLNSFMIGCNCISKIILSDMRMCMKMPLLVVQIDRNFLSINLYDDMTLAFSRFTDVDPADYGFASDYMSQAVNENIFRMLQFQKTRKSDQPIENVVFYGDLDNVEDIINNLDQMDVSGTIMRVPPQVRGCENIDFPIYANAIGALFKRNKATEKINLLETDTLRRGGGGGGKKGGDSAAAAEPASGVPILIALLLAVGAVGGVWFVMDTKYRAVSSDLSEVQSKIDAAQSEKDLFDKLTVQEEKINQYRNDISIAADAFKTHPKISIDYFNIIEGEMANAAAELGLWAQITSFSYGGYTINLGIKTAAEAEPSQTLPSLIVEKLLMHPEFANVKYNGYSLSQDENGKIVNYTLQIPLSPIEPTTEPETNPDTTPVTEESQETPEAQN